MRLAILDLEERYRDLANLRYRYRESHLPQLCLKPYQTNQVQFLHALANVPIDLKSLFFQRELPTV